jgi:hypothetical protein
MKAVDWAVDKIVKLGKNIWAKLKAVGKKSKGKDASSDNAQGASQTREWAKRQVAQVRQDLPITV